MIDAEIERSNFELYELSKRPCAKRESIFERFDSNGLGESEQHYVGKYVDSYMQEKWELWEKAKSQTIPEGYVLIPLEPTEQQWGGLSRVLGRYMQSKDRYCPKTLKKHLDMFAHEIPDWLNKEVGNWESEHAFATADLPVFIYKAMINERESGAEQ
ncbi:hypothetical protein [Acinetobacter baumannii]|uniref:hypothetical protein n=1 Tax=Acinetobacter baumannii TaxID=470 RepID=UPI0024166FC8|nr:hypothetical protein [Acinetobacter baumannii]WFQ22475.1 hypothetical protein P9J63_05720 [Acinetobacter baumannii]WFQ26092.1 hypothetical protein P9J61_05705 [Acinetobacter baumannii]WFQ29743.1 hypothetical protein P9J59_05710 [Acinetobacter baumannii]